MDKELIDQLWLKAMREAIENGEQFTRYRFAELVADAEAKRMQDEGMVTIGHMREQVAKEREVCAAECERMIMYPGGRQVSAAHQNVWDAAKAIRARGND